MATGTACSNTCVIHRRTSFKAGGGFVASFAGSSRHNMCGWFSFHIGEIATVAGRAARGDACVVHHRRHKGGGAGVAGFALGVGADRNMCA